MRLLAFERPAWSGWRERINGVSWRLEKWLDVEAGLHWLLHHWLPVGVAAFLLIAALYGLSGVAVIGPDERAVVRRFGRALPDDLDPGLHLCWPWPVDVVTRVRPDRITTVEVGFRSAAPAGDRPIVRSWSSTHGDDGLCRVPEEAVMMTGDGNLVEMQATIRYTISDPRVYLFEADDVPGVLRGAAESVLRELVAGRTFADLLTIDREAFHTAALDRLRQRCEANRLGVRLEGLSVADLHPPQEVVEAYHQVTTAMEKRDERVNQATSEALSRERKQESESLQTVRRAEAAVLDKVRRAKATRDAVTARIGARRALAWNQEWDLLRSAALETWRDAPAEEVERHYRERRAAAVGRQAMLTDFRLYWEALSSALMDREKVIIDAENVPGRRHLWLTPFPLPAAEP
jgi:Cu+-exporting ATPase